MIFKNEKYRKTKQYADYKKGSKKGSVETDDHRLSPSASLCRFAGLSGVLFLFRSHNFRLLSSTSWNKVALRWSVDSDKLSLLSSSDVSAGLWGIIKEAY